MAEGTSAIMMTNLLIGHKAISHDRTMVLSWANRGASIPGYPSLTVGLGYPTEFQKGHGGPGIDIPPGVKMLGCQLAQAGSKVLKLA